MQRVLTLSLLLAMVGCAGSGLRWQPDVHEVRDGETLYSIAWRYHLDHRQLAAWNGLGDGTLIYPGQRIRLSAPRAGSGRTASRSRQQSADDKAPPVRTKPRVTPPAPPVDAWRWPTRGPLLARFGASAKTASGIQIGGKPGQDVRAAAAGAVVYAGSGLASYGQLLIIKHNEAYLSAYGFNDELTVVEGQRVAAGQPVARMGRGAGQRAMLFFEIRRDGRPVDPLAFLPSR